MKKLLIFIGCLATGAFAEDGVADSLAPFVLPFFVIALLYFALEVLGVLLYFVLEALRKVELLIFALQTTLKRLWQKMNLFGKIALVIVPVSLIALCALCGIGYGLYCLLVPFTIFSAIVTGLVVYGYAALAFRSGWDAGDMLGRDLKRPKKGCYAKFCRIYSVSVTFPFLILCWPVYEALKHGRDLFVRFSRKLFFKQSKPQIPSSRK